MAVFRIPPAALHLPDSIGIPLLGGVWHVYARPEPGETLHLQEESGPGAGGRLLFAGPTRHTAACCRLLREWLRRLGRRHLPQRVQRMAQGMGLTVNGVQVRAQRSRWGSCSSRGTISLNCRLLLLPVYLLDHVILHELCHITHLNHSKEYRQHLSIYAPDWKQKEKMLHNAWKNMPLWAII